MGKGAPYPDDVVVTAGSASEHFRWRQVLRRPAARADRSGAVIVIYDNCCGTGTGWRSLRGRWRGPAIG
jgi:hypothetical protein